MSPIQLANAPCSWGVLEFDIEGGDRRYAEVLDEITEAGYKGTELGDWGFMPTDPEVLRRNLTQRGLAMLATFVPVALADPETHASGAATAVRTARLLAAVTEKPLIVLADNNTTDPVRTKNAGRIQPEHGLTDEQWDHFIQGAEQVAREVRIATGARTAFHHHCAGFIETPGEIARFMSRTDPELIGLCFDTGHFAYGGGDPLEGRAPVAIALAAQRSLEENRPVKVSEVE